MKKSYLLLLLLLAHVLMPFRGHSQDTQTDRISDNGQAGQGLLPVPQQISLSNLRYPLDDSWNINAGNISKNDPAIVSLLSELKERFGLKVNTTGRRGAHGVQMVVKPGSVIIGKTVDSNRTELSKQAYRLKLEADRISITANGSQGLFYGVQTLLQLLQPGNGNVSYNGGEITDWPVMNLRLIYWDDAHHLERLGAMKRALRQASYYKINAFSLKLEGHFQFSAAKPIVEPYAYTPSEYQELTDYAKAHYVELVPYLDAPAHIAFILKHPEYAGLRASPNSNYELDVTNSKADELMSAMLDNLVEANKGGKYIVLSTDEAYYVGKVESEKKRAEALGSNGKLLADYVTRISAKLHAKGRKIIIWVEYPMKPADINLLPSYIINGEYDKEWAPKVKEHGMRQLIYTSIQGEELLFPNYYKLPPVKSPPKKADDEEENDNSPKGRIAEAVGTITSAVSAANADLMGVVVAGWADAGLNPETFWLGYATAASTAWNNQFTNAPDLSSRFYNSFYGYKAVNMDKVYQLLSTQAQFYSKSWEWEHSNWRTPIFGNSFGIFDTAKPARDQTLPYLPVSSATNLSLNADWSNNNKERLVRAQKFLEQNNELMNLLQQNLVSVDYHHYNLQVLLSVAQFCRQNIKMLLGLKRINDLMTLSSVIAGNNPAAAISLIDQALDQLKVIRDDRNEVLQTVTAVWYQDWYPRVSEANGRKFLDLVDDVKDHQPARTVDMRYLVYRQLKYPLGKWAEDEVRARNQFAQTNNLPVRTESFNWESIE